MKEKRKKNKVYDQSPEEPAVVLFHQGENFSAYEYFGCHKMADSGIHTYVFRVWAPHADAVTLVSDFCGWEDGVPMHRLANTGVWELQYGSPHSLENNFYKYKVTGKGISRYKADPYAVASQTRGETASILRDDLAFAWEDSLWLDYRRFVAKEKNSYRAPLNIYGLHPGSWRKNGAGELNYRQLADRLAPYVKQMGYTHVELTPVMEYPDDRSFGYRTGSYYAPTSRYGTPEDLMYLVNKLHLCGVGVILDWVPACFPCDVHGLFEFDGQPLYERMPEEPQDEEYSNDVRFFDVRKNEVQSFLISNALYWFRRFHADGLRLVSVPAMLAFGPLGEEDPAAVAFLQKLNGAVAAEFPSALMIADEISFRSGVTAPPSEGGLGFRLAWNTAWTGAICSYVSSDPIYRQYMHDKLSTPLICARDGNGVLPISHETVSGGQRALIDKMYGGYEEKFASMRAFLVYMMTFPGKKLTFMGCELAQFREWDPGGELEWFMVDHYPRHAEMHRFIQELNSFYLSQPPLWELDDVPDGFSWIEPNDKERNVISYRRIAGDQSELLVVVSFSPVPYGAYRMYVPDAGRYEILFRTDAPAYGGSGDRIGSELRTKKQKDNKTVRHYLELELPPYASRILRRLPAFGEPRRNNDRPKRAQGASDINAL